MLHDLFDAYLHLQYPQTLCVYSWVSLQHPTCEAQTSDAQFSETDRKFSYNFESGV